MNRDREPKEMSMAAYARWNHKVTRDAYQERWGDFTSPKPTRSILVTTREIPGTELVKNGDGQIIRIPVIPNNPS